MIEVSEFVTRQTVERAYRRAKQEQEKGNHGYAKRGMNCARARDPKLLMVLEKAAEILVAVSNEQYGEYRQRRDIPYSHKVEPTEVQMWKEAYKTCDNGDPCEPLMWIYGCATELAYGRN